MAQAKPVINIVFVGHVDHGKSTLLGRLLYDSGKIPEQELKKARETAEKLGKKGFEFAYLLDRLKEERERGVTIDLAYKKITTNKYEVTVIDAPGHRDFVKNMITGASQADAAFLVVNAAEGVMAQTKEHIHLCYTMGVEQICVVFNKMDLVDYKEDAYKKLKEDLTALIKTVGYNTAKINFIPVSAIMGEGVVKKSEKMKWYTGPTIMEQLDLFEMPKKPIELPLRMPVENVYEITGVGVVPVGKIISGKMKVGQKVIILPGRSGKGISGEVKTIEAHHESMPEAMAGDNVGVNIRGVSKKDIARGDVIADAANPPKVVEEFTAKVVVINVKRAIAPGYTPVFHTHTAQVPCQFTELIRTIDPKTGGTLKDKPDFLKNGDMAEVKLKPKMPMVIEKNSDNPHMARFAIRDAGSTVAAGVCTNVVEKK